MKTLLSSTQEIQDAIVALMKPGTRRVAIVAFVGTGATAYIPKPKGVTVVCWPKAGGTAPSAVRELIRRDADVRFADRVHMKLYWARGRGALIGSPNLTTNALGSGGLKELAVRVKAETVPINRLLKLTGSRPVSEKALKKLDLAHAKLGRRLVGSEPVIDYTTWFHSIHRTAWKIGWWVEKGAFPRTVTKKAKEEFDSKPSEAICGRHGDYRTGDWILSFGLPDKTAIDPVWIYVNFVVKVTNSSKEKYPWDAVQVYTNRQRTTPPFALTKSFKKALRSACSRFGVGKLKTMKSVRPPEKFLSLLLERLK